MGNGPNQPPITIGSDPIAFTTSFVYFGLEVSDTGNLYLEINRRCGLATSVMGNSSWPTKLQVYNAAVLFVLVYSIEKWPLRKTLASFIHSLESCALRIIEEVHSSNLVFNKELVWRISQLSILHTIAQHHVGHVLRWPDNHPLRVICKLSTTSQQTTQPLEVHPPPGFPTD